MSTEYADDLWQRACRALRSAEALLPVSADDAASRAYYAAFHAVSAWFAVQGRVFSKHTAIRAAVHRDLVHAGVWPSALGEAFDALWELRDTGDYGGGVHVSADDAKEAIAAAKAIVSAVGKECAFSDVAPSTPNQ